MRSYGQFCGLAKSLDVIGDRWTLLIVRELLIRGPSRYTDLRIGLPGIPTNLLADRLRDMEEAGGRVTARLGPADKPDAVISGPTPLAWQLLLAKIDLAHARKAGLAVEGKPATLKRFGPLPRQ